MSDKVERREEIKMYLEYTKLALSLAGIVTILIAAWQWAASVRSNNEAVYQRMTSIWSEHLKLFIEKPEFRPYFESGMQLDESNERTRNTVLAIADARMDAADAILSFAAFHEFKDIRGWERTFASAFRSSPVLCKRFQETRTNFVLLVPIGDEACEHRPQGRSLMLRKPPKSARRISNAAAASPR